MFNYSMLDPSRIEYFEIAPADQIPPGKRLFIAVRGNSIVLFNLAGYLYALGDICSHDDGPVGDGAVEGSEIICPRHGAHFDIRSGKASSLPAVVDIPAYPVRVVNGIVEIGLLKE